jgi:hypothetical protein
MLGTHIEQERHDHEKEKMKEKTRIMGLNACALACFEISVRLAKYRD